MTLILESYDSLPYIDSDTSQHARDAAETLIAKELKSTERTGLHSSLPPIDAAQFSEVMTNELDRVAAGKKIKGGIDLERYEAPDEPSTDSAVSAWRNALKKAYSSNSYISGRSVNLSLLEEFGKNAWLISNSQLDQLLKAQERELERLKRETESVNKERKEAQGQSSGEIQALEDTWKQGIRRLVEVQLATDKLRQEMQST